MRRALGLALLLLAAGGSASTAGRKEDWDGLRAQIRTTLHIPEELPSVNEKFYGSFLPERDIQADRISYATVYGNRVPAIVYHPAGATIVQHPGLVIVNGHNGDKSSVYAYWAGILYARAGAVVLTYDPIGEFERNKDKRSATREHDTKLEPEDMALRLTGSMVSDVMQGVRYLEARKDVDPKRIAVLGFSMGSFISSLACATDTEVHACVLVGGGDLDGAGGYWDNSSPMCQGTAYRALEFLGNRGAALFALNAKRGPTLVWNGRDDAVVDIPQHGDEFFGQLRADTIARAGSPKDVFEYGLVPGGHRPYFLTRPVALWLNGKLKFPNWTRKQIEELPETHVSEWEIKNRLMEKTSEAHESGIGGLMALGADVPVINREQLLAVPDGVWATDQDEYTYGGWVTKARAAEQAAR